MKARDVVAAHNLLLELESLQKLHRSIGMARHESTLCVAISSPGSDRGGTIYLPREEILTFLLGAISDRELRLKTLGVEA